MEVSVVCGDLNARGGVHAYPCAQDVFTDSRGITMCQALRSEGLELLPTYSAAGLPAPVTRGLDATSGSMLDYCWVVGAGY